MKENFLETAKIRALASVRFSTDKTLQPKRNSAHTIVTER